MLALTYKGWNGVEAALNTIIQTFGVGEIKFLDEGHLNIEKYFYKLNIFKYKTIIIGGYGDAVNALIEKMPPTTKIISLWCSNILQSELTRETHAMSQMIKYLANGKIFSLAFIDFNSYQTLKSLLPKLNVSYLPVFSVPTQPSVKINLPQETSNFNIDVFCTPDGRKNIINQLFILSQISTVHTNYEIEPYKLFVKTIPNVINYGRMLKENLTNYSASMDLCSQVSLNESYNYVAADHMFLGVPVLSSMFVPAIMEIDDNLIKKYLIIQDPTSMEEMRNKVNFLKNNPSLLKELGCRCKEGVAIMSKKRKQVLIKNLKRLTL